VLAAQLQQTGVIVAAQHCAVVCQQQSSECTLDGTWKRIVAAQRVAPVSELQGLDKQVTKTARCVSLRTRRLLLRHGEAAAR
jgi:hypothetical protein